MKTLVGTVFVLALSSVGVFGCSSDGEDARDADVVRSSLTRNESPNVPAEDLAQFASDEAAFAVDIYQAIRKTPGSESANVFLSPHSISTALAMTYAGARGKTAEEMKLALHFGLPDTRLHAAFDWLDLTLAKQNRTENPADGDTPQTLKLANSIWGQKGTSFQTPFLDTLAVDYGAGIHAVDFQGDPKGSRTKINRWTEDQTEQRIKDLLPPNAIDGRTKLVLVNAVYFHAAWLTPFANSDTAPGPFTTRDGRTISVPMMHGTTERPYFATDDFEAVGLPYNGGNGPGLAMVVIAPKKGTFETFEATMTGTKVLDLLSRFAQKSVRLSLPTLKMETSYQLENPLRSLGMVAPFDHADFGGISEELGLQIDSVVHKTFLAVDERGTEAAAATAVTMNELAMDPTPLEMNVDRPFILTIVDPQTKTLLFLGRVLEPTN